MIPRIACIAAAAAVAAFVLWHPARPPVAASLPAPAPATAVPAGDVSRHNRAGDDDGLIVYVAGAVKRPGLYHLRPGERGARAVALAGGMTAAADAGAINLAARAQDGDEIFVPDGKAHQVRETHRGRRHAVSPPEASIDVNRSNAAELGAVPGLGRSIAARIVELREREGAFASLDELLDVAGMTQTRLERARPYLRVR